MSFETTFFWTCFAYLIILYALMFWNLQDKRFGLYLAITMGATPMMLMGMTLTSTAINYPITGNLTVYNDNTEISTEWFQTNVLSAMPEQSYKDLNRIIITPDIPNNKEAQQLITLGDYTKVTKTIRIVPDNPELLRHTLAHELGHHNYQTLTTEQKTQWKQLHKNTTEWVPNYINVVPNYAKTNPEEDYAEHTAYTLAERAISTDLAKMQLINQTLLTKLNWTYKPYENFYIIEEETK